MDAMTINPKLLGRNQENLELPSPGMIFSQDTDDTQDVAKYNWLRRRSDAEMMEIRREEVRRSITVCYLEILWSGLVCPDDKLHLITTEICPIIYTIASITTDTNIILQHICNSLLSNRAILGKYHNTTLQQLFLRKYNSFFSCHGNNLG